MIAPRALLLAAPLALACRSDFPVAPGSVDSDPPTVDETDPSPSDTAPVDSGDSDPTGPDTGRGDDADGDTVPDTDDVCPGLDDRVDLNADAVPDCAQDLLANGQVTTDLAGWFEETIGSNVSTAAWSTTDASGWARSGSVEVVNRTVTTVANAAGVRSACHAAAPGTTFDVWYHYEVPTGGGTGPLLVTSFDTFADAGCTTPLASTTPGPPATVVGGGWHVMHMGSPITLWPDWHALQVRIELYKPGDGEPMTFRVDDLLLLEVQ